MSSQTHDGQGRDFYAILEVPRHATAVEIKKAYRKKSLKVHPDRNGNNPSAKAQFQEISEIYSVLSDATKRKIYDAHGEPGLKSRGFNPENCNVDDLLSAVFGDDDSKDSCQAADGRELAKVTVDVDLRDLYHGASRSVEYSYHFNCGECNGTGATRSDVNKDCRHCCEGKVDETYKQAQSCARCRGSGVQKPPFTCTACAGTGVTSSFFGDEYQCQSCAGAGKFNSFPCGKCNGRCKYCSVRNMSYKNCGECKGKGKLFSKACDTCQGQGKSLVSRTRSVSCQKCDGRGFHTKVKSVSCKVCGGQKKFLAYGKATVDIQRGTHHQEVLHVQHHDHQRGVYGVVLVTVNCADIARTRFVVQDDDLLTFHSISLRQALLGGDFVFEHVCGDKMAVSCGPDINVIGFGEFKKIENAGMPKKGIANAFGDLYIKFSIEMPKMHQLTDKQKQNIKELCQAMSLSDGDSREDARDTSRTVQLRNVTGFEPMTIAAAEDKVVAKMNEVKGETAAQQLQKGKEQAPECKQM